MSKYNLIQNPTQAPAKCIGCFNGGRPVVDWNMDVDGYGAVYMCIPCIVEAAELAGLVSPAKYAELERAREDLIEYTRKAEDAVKSAADSITSLVRDINAVVPEHVVSIPEEPDFDLDALVNDGEPEAKPSGGTKATNKFAK